MFTLPPLSNVEPQVEGAKWALNANDTGISGRVLTQLLAHQKGRLTTGARGLDFKNISLNINPNGAFHITLVQGWSAYIQQDGSVLFAFSKGLTSVLYPWVMRLPQRRLKTAPTDTYRGLDNTVRQLTPYEGLLSSSTENQDENSPPIMVQTPINDRQSNITGMPTPILGAVVQSFFAQLFDPNSRMPATHLELDSAILDAEHPELFHIPRFVLKGVVTFIPDNTKALDYSERKLRKLVASDPKLFLGPNAFGQKFGEHTHSGSNWNVEPSFKFQQRIHPQAKQNFSNHLMVQAEQILREHNFEKLTFKSV